MRLKHLRCRILQRKGTVNKRGVFSENAMYRTLLATCGPALYAPSLRTFFSSKQKKLFSFCSPLAFHYLCPSLTILLGIFSLPGRISSLFITNMNTRYLLLLFLSVMISLPAMADKKPGFKKGVHDYTYADGRTYSGNWEKYQPSGLGKMTMPNGDTYEGNWVLGQLEGKGLLKLADGSILKGNFANTAPAGEFEAAYANGESYTGGMQGMNFHGQGYWKGIDGSWYRGGYVNGKREGQGECCTADGTHYIGGFKNDTYNGWGKLQKPNGDMLEGSFRNGVTTGEITIQEANGNVFKGVIDAQGRKTGQQTEKVGELTFTYRVVDGVPTGEGTATGKVDGQEVEQTFEYINGVRAIKRIFYTNGTTFIFEAPYYTTGLERVKGKIVADDFTYIGELKGEIPDGEGEARGSKTGSFVGTFKEGQALTGIAKEWKVIPSEGASYIYTGAIENGKRTGQGKCVCDLGVYEGQWVNDRFHGQGSMYWGDGDGEEYVGQWKDGKMDGQGTMTYADGRKYVGQWKDGMCHGQGTMTYANGQKYVGQWKDGMYYGQGTYTYASGAKYVGQWKDDQRSGQGTMIYANGEKYVGQWRNDQPNGKGTMYYAPGQVWIKTTGYFIDGNFRSGTLVRRNGTFVGTWDENGNPGYGNVRVK